MTDVVEDLVDSGSAEEDWEDGWEIDTDVSIPGAGAVVGEDPILHSDRFALVDRRGRIRGYYDGLNENEVKQMQEDAAQLLTEGKR